MLQRGTAIPHGCEGEFGLPALAIEATTNPSQALRGRDAHGATFMRRNARRASATQEGLGAQGKTCRMAELAMG